MISTEFAAIQSKIRRCTRCIDEGFIESAHPILFGTPRARVMILGQAPGPTATERPLPYSGASGKTLQSWLRRAGFEDGALHDPSQFYLTSTTKCFPGRASSGKGDRAPGRREVQLCSDHLNVELEWVKPDLILAMGRLAIGTMISSLRRLALANIVGEAYPAEYAAAGEALILPLPHPSGVSRWHNDPTNQAKLARALHVLDRTRQEFAL